MPDPIPMATQVGGAKPALGYPRPAERQRWTARRVRYVLLFVAVSVAGLGVLLNPVINLHPKLGWGIYGTPAAPVMDAAGRSATGDVSLQAYLSEAMIFFGAVLASQWMFLLPRGRLSFQTSDRVRSLRWAVVGGGFVGALVSIGLAATVLELLGYWRELFTRDWSVGTLILNQDFRALWLAMLLAWAGWAGLFYLYCRDADHRTAVARVTRIVLAGTVLELIVSIPAYAKSVRSSDDCPCATGSYTGLVFGATALFWLFGPGIYLLFHRERRRWKPPGGTAPQKRG